MPKLNMGLVLAMSFLGLLFVTSTSGRAQPPVPSDTKFALLVGIDDYAQPDDTAYRITPLKGPGNDVAMMKKLLVDQFGFPDDKAHIATLTGKQATRENILNSLNQQLIENAKAHPDATVVFFFSGHGSLYPDENDAKGSGFHQTLVAYDSRVEGGKDILDDEINQRLELLRQYTNRITLIFDSCHSGSVWKDVTTMTSKSLPPNRFTKPGLAIGPALTKDVGTTIKPSGGAYSVIVAATADETAVEDAVPSAKGEYHGLLTYYLDQVVRGSSDLTYDEAARRAAVHVTAHAPTQHPQAEGDINRVLLGGAAEHKDPYIQVLDVGGDHKKFRISAGSASGLQNGAILAVYDKNAKELVGDEGRIANAQVIEVLDFDAAAQLKESSEKSSKYRLESEDCYALCSTWRDAGVCPDDRE